MIFFFENLGKFKNVTICYPIYIIQNDELLTFPWFLLEVIEFSLYVFTVFYLLKVFYIAIKIRTFHKNLTTIFVFFVFQWYETFVANVLSWPYETGYWTLKGTMNENQTNVILKQWYTEKLNEMIPMSYHKSDIIFFLSGFLKMHSSLSMTTILLSISVERCFACYHLNDYEKKSRFWIALLIISVSHIYNFIIAFVFYFKLIPFECMIVCILAPNVIGFKLLFYTRYLNQKVTEAHEKFASHSNYTLAARFQAKENIKCFRMIQMVIICGMGILALGISTAVLLFLNILPKFDTLFNGIIQGEMSFTPMIISISINYSVESFRKVKVFDWDSIWEKLRVSRRKVALVRKDSSVKIEMIRKETETYFNQLANSWI
ncbi:hypothetical protein CRE_04102 [Caenorhabditis remanei]|uniref:Uncharacterized protein n=1 Tax=Caenorhabditis remanei TaxID=31234 RepID=E3MMX3_CAERE|nr:hypothetical protein CRE_04102 [Caenorhabditis remanei]